MADLKYLQYASNLYGVPMEAFSITPNDGADLSEAIRAIWVGVAGDIRVTMHGLGGGDAGATLTFKNVPVGRFEGCFDRVWATGTTATNLIGYP